MTAPSPRPSISDSEAIRFEHVSVRFGGVRVVVVAGLVGACSLMLLGMAGNYQLLLATTLVINHQPKQGRFQEAAESSQFWICIAKIAA